MEALTVLCLYKNVLYSEKIPPLFHDCFFCELSGALPALCCIIFPQLRILHDPEHGFCHRCFTRIKFRTDVLPAGADPRHEPVRKAARGVEAAPVAKAFVRVEQPEQRVLLAPHVPAAIYGLAGHAASRGWRRARCPERAPRKQGARRRDLSRTSQALRRKHRRS